MVQWFCLFILHWRPFSLLVLFAIKIFQFYWQSTIQVSYAVLRQLSLCILNEPRKPTDRLCGFGEHLTILSQQAQLIINNDCVLVRILSKFQAFAVLLWATGQQMVPYSKFCSWIVLRPSLKQTHNFSDHVHVICHQFQEGCLISIEPPHNQTNKMTCAPSEDKDEPGHPSCLIRLRCPHQEGSSP